MRIDRIIILVFLIAITQGFLLVVDPTSGLLANTIPTELTLPLTVIVLAALVTITVGIADATVRSHPQIYLLKLPTFRFGSNKLELAPFSWVLPGLLVVGSYLFLRLFQDLTVQIVGTIIASIVLLIVIIAQYYTVGRQERLYGWAIIGLNIATYLAGFLLFSAIYVNKWRALQSAPLIAIVTMLLTYELLRSSKVSGRTLLTYAIINGLVLAQVTWALNYWRVKVLIGGIIPLLVFYVLVGIMQAYLTKNLNRSVVREYMIISIFSVVLILWAAIANVQV